MAEAVHVHSMIEMATDTWGKRTAKRAALSKLNQTYAEQIAINSGRVSTLRLNSLLWCRW